jgi:hypothetical protein
MKYATSVKSLQTLCLLDMSISLHTDLAAVEHAAEGQFLPARML